MAYFYEFPRVTYQFPDDNRRLYKNISIRPAIIQRVLEKQSNFETYSVQDGETPETLAFDFYGDVNLHWTIMLANNIMNLYTDWPRDTVQFDEYMFQKYKLNDSDTDRLAVSRYIEFAGSTANNWLDSDGRGRLMRPHHFMGVDDNEYSYETIVGRSSDLRDVFGNVVDVPEVTPVSIYQYEFDLNEAKREILILKLAVVERLQDDLRKLTHE